MKTKHLLSLALTALLATSMACSHTAQQPPKMKMTTEIPANVITPDKMETRIGTLNFVRWCADRRNCTEGLGSARFRARRGGHDNDYSGSFSARLS